MILAFNERFFDKNSEMVKEAGVFKRRVCYEEKICIDPEIRRM